MALSKKRKFAEDVRQIVEERFQFTLPEDMLDIYTLASEINSNYPLLAFEPLKIRLVGPFEVLHDSLAKTDAHTWRFWADPPEVTTVAVDIENGTHFAYFRDSPGELPVGIVSARKGSNKFAFVAASISALLKIKMVGPPTEEKSIALLRSYLSRVPKALLESASWRAREARLVGSTSLGLGVCVRYDKKRQTGYRALLVSKKELRRMFEGIKQKTGVEKNRRKLEEVFNWVNIGNDEMDFGQGFELGCELFAADSPSDEQPVAFCKAASIFLRNAYSLLGRQAWIAVLEAAIEGMKKMSAQRNRDGMPEALKGSYLDSK